MPGVAEHLVVRSAAASPVHMEVAPWIRAAGTRPGPAVCFLSMQQRCLYLEQACRSVRHLDCALMASASGLYLSDRLSMGWWQRQRVTARTCGGRFMALWMKSPHCWHLHQTR